MLDGLCLAKQKEPVTLACQVERLSHLRHRFASLSIFGGNCEELRGIAEIAILQFYFDACENLATAILQLAVQLFVTLGADHPLAGWANGPSSKKDC